MRQYLENGRRYIRSYYKWPIGSCIYTLSIDTKIDDLDDLELL